MGGATGTAGEPLAGDFLAGTFLAGATLTGALAKGFGAAVLAGAFLATDDLAGILVVLLATASGLAALVVLPMGAAAATLVVFLATVFADDADARAEAALEVGLPDFAAVGAGAFTTGLLSGDDDAGTAGGCRRVVLA